MVSLKIDSYSICARPLFDINAQFIDKKAVQIRTLKVKEMLTNQSALNIESEMFLTAADYNVPTSNVYTVTCDNGANMILASHLISDEQKEKEAAGRVDESEDVSFHCQALHEEEWEAGCSASVSHASV